jgi:hypothetical protein
MQYENHKEIYRMITSRRMRWAGNVALMGGRRMNIRF